MEEIPDREGQWTSYQQGYLDASKSNDTKWAPLSVLTDPFVQFLDFTKEIDSSFKSHDFDGESVRRTQPKIDTHSLYCSGLA